MTVVTEADYRDPAARIVGAVAALPAHLQLAVAQSLTADRSPKLSRIGKALFAADPVVELAQVLPSEVFLGGVEEIPRSCLAAPSPGQASAWPSRTQ